MSHPPTLITLPMQKALDRRARQEAIVFLVLDGAVFLASLFAGAVFCLLAGVLTGAI